MKILIFFNIIITSIDKKISKIPRKTNLLMENKHKISDIKLTTKYKTTDLLEENDNTETSSSKNLFKKFSDTKSCIQSVLNYDLKVGEMSLREMKQTNNNEIEALNDFKEYLRVRDIIEEQELQEFEEFEKQIEKEENEIRKITNLKCRRFNYEIDLQINDLISELSENSKETKEKFDKCLNLFLNIFNESRPNNDDILNFRKALNNSLKNILLRYLDFLMKKMPYKYEIRDLLFLIKKDLSTKRDAISNLLYDTANLLEKKSDYNFILYLFSCCIKQYSQMDSDSERLRIFISLYLFFLKYIPSEKNKFRFEISENKYLKLCNNNTLFISNMMTDIKNIGNIENRNSTEQYCKSLADRYKKSDKLISLFYESWSELFKFISDLSIKNKSTKKYIK